jgi:hypothetical protein
MTRCAAAIAIAIEWIGRHKLFIEVACVSFSTRLREREAVGLVVVEWEREILIHVRKQTRVESANTVEPCVYRLVRFRVLESENIKNGFDDGR